MKETDSTYRDHLIETVAPEFDSLKTLEDRLERMENRLAGASALVDFSRSNTTIAADSRELDEYFEDDVDVLDNLFEEYGQEAIESKVESRLQQTSTAVLAKLAEDRNLDSEIELAAEDFECPLCEITSSACGEDGQCVYETLTEQVNTEIPIIVDLLVSYRHGLAQR